MWSSGSFFSQWIWSSGVFFKGFYNSASFVPNGFDTSVHFVPKEFDTWVYSFPNEFDLENYTGAKKIYQEILSANPSDLFAKSQIKKCDKFTEPRLSITPNTLIFPSDASTNTINIETNSDSYSISKLPKWCTVIKQKDYIRVSCVKNKRRKARSGSFQIKSGPNLRIVDITQMGKGKKSK